VSRHLGILSSEVQDAAQHCDQLRSLAGNIGKKKFPKYVHEILYIHIVLAGRAAELSLPRQGHLEVSNAALQRCYLRDGGEGIASN
jgi:hypothetical protein